MSIFLTYSIEMTSMEKQQTALHFWSLTPPSSNSGCGGDSEAFGLHRPAQGGELQSALTCGPLAVPPSADPEQSPPLQGHLGREISALPHCPGVSSRRLRQPLPRQPWYLQHLLQGFVCRSQSSSQNWPHTQALWCVTL